MTIAQNPHTTPNPHHTQHNPHLHSTGHHPKPHTRFRHFPSFYNFLNAHSKQVLAASILLSGSILGVSMFATGNLDNRNKAFSGIETIDTNNLEFQIENFKNLGAVTNPTTPQNYSDTTKQQYYNLVETYTQANTINSDQSGANITASSFYNSPTDTTYIFIRTTNLPELSGYMLRSYLYNAIGEDVGFAVMEFHNEDGNTVGYLAGQASGDLSKSYSGLLLSYDTPDSEGPVIPIIKLIF